MRVIDINTEEILVGRAPAGEAVEVRIEGTAHDRDRVIRLSREQARRLAAQILAQAAKLDEARRIVEEPSLARKSA
jgi:hypothetical protein